MLSLFVGVLTASLIAGPIFFANARFYAAMRVSDFTALESAGNQFPKDVRRLYILAGVFRNAQQDVKAITVLRDATVHYPDSIDLWTLWTTIPTVSPSDLATAILQIKRLNPFSPG